MKAVKKIAVLILAALLLASICACADEELENKEVDTNESDTNKPNEPDIKENRYEEFIKAAEEIEEYSKESFETAQKQAEINEVTNNVFVKWDTLLQDLYDHIKSGASDEELKELEAEREKWQKEMDDEVSKTADAWKGGSGMPMACDSVKIKYTKDRFNALVSLLEK